MPEVITIEAIKFIATMVAQGIVVWRVIDVRLTRIERRIMGLEIATQLKNEEDRRMALDASK